MSIYLLDTNIASHLIRGDRPILISRLAREAAGKTLAQVDLLIAAHAQAVGAILVTSDAAFFGGPGGPLLEDWTK